MKLVHRVARLYAGALSHCKHNYDDWVMAGRRYFARFSQIGRHVRNGFRRTASPEHRSFAHTVCCLEVNNNDSMVVDNDASWPEIGSPLHNRINQKNLDCVKVRFSLILLLRA